MSALVNDRDFLSDNLNNLAVMTCFCEEVAGALASPKNPGLSGNGWAGFSTVLGLIREGLEELERQNPPA